MEPGGRQALQRPAQRGGQRTWGLLSLLPPLGHQRQHVRGRAASDGHTPLWLLVSLLKPRLPQSGAALREEQTQNLSGAKRTPQSA